MKPHKTPSNVIPGFASASSVVGLSVAHPKAIFKGPFPRGSASGVETRPKQQVSRRGCSMFWRQVEDGRSVTGFLADAYLYLSPWRTIITGFEVC